MSATVVFPEREGGSADEIATAVETCEAKAAEASASATAALTAETNAETAETNAETAETNAETAASNAAASAASASASATTATTQAGLAAASAAEAAGYVAGVAAEGAEQIGLVNAAGTTNVSAVNAAGAAVTGTGGTIDVREDAALAAVDGAVEDAVDAATTDLLADLTEAASARIFTTIDVALAEASVAVNEEFGVPHVFGLGADYYRKNSGVSATYLYTRPFASGHDARLIDIVGRSTRVRRAPPTGATWIHRSRTATLNDMRLCPNEVSDDEPSRQVFSWGYGRLRFQSTSGTLVQQYSYEGGSATVASQGAGGYLHGEHVTLVGETGTAAQFTLTVVSGDVTTLTPRPGFYGDLTSAPLVNPVAVTGGSGTGLTLNVYRGPWAKWTTSAVNQRLQWKTGSSPPNALLSGVLDTVLRMESLSGTPTIQWGHSSAFLSAVLTGPGTIDTLTGAFTVLDSTIMSITAPASGTAVKILSLAGYPKHTTPTVHPGQADFNWHFRPGAFAGPGGFARSRYTIDNTASMGSGVITPPLFPGETTMTKWSFGIVIDVPAAMAGNAVIICNDTNPSNQGGAQNTDRWQLRLESDSSIHFSINGSSKCLQGPDSGRYDFAGKRTAITWCGEDGRFLVEINGVPYLTSEEDIAFTFDPLDFLAIRVFSASNTASAYVTSSELACLFHLSAFYLNTFLDEDGRIQLFEWMRDEMDLEGTPLTIPETWAYQGGDSTDGWNSNPVGGCAVYLHYAARTLDNVRIGAEGGADIDAQTARFATIVEPFIRRVKALGSRPVVYFPPSINDYSEIAADWEGWYESKFLPAIAEIRAMSASDGLPTRIWTRTPRARGDTGAVSAGYDAAKNLMAARMLADTDDGVYDAICDQAASDLGSEVLAQAGLTGSGSLFRTDHYHLDTPGQELSETLEAPVWTEMLAA